MRDIDKATRATSEGFVARFKKAWSVMRGPSAMQDETGAATHPEDLARILRSGARSSSGVRVTSDSAMRASAVFACVKVISEDLSCMPLNVYKTLSPQGRKLAPDHRVFNLLHTRPNEIQTSMEFREMLQAWSLLRGNGYALKSIVRGQVDELLPLPSDNVIPKLLDGGRLVYEVQPLLGGTPRIYEREQMFHLRGLSFNGYVGRSVIADAREAIGMAEAQEGYGAEAFRDGGMQRIALKHTGNLSAPAAGRLRESWVEVYGGPGRFSKPAVLEEGMDVVKIGLSPSDMQFLDGRKFQAEDIARFFRVSPHKIGLLDRATNNNVEQMALDHVTSTLMPWAVRWEQALGRDLLDRPSDSVYFIKHLFDSLLRGDPVNRAKVYAAGRQWGYLSANEIREMEDMNPIDGGDKYLVPVNMRNSDEPAPAPAPFGGFPGEPAPAQPEPEDEPGSFGEADPKEKNDD